VFILTLETLVIVVMQVTFVPLLFVGQAALDLVLVGIILWSILRKGQEALVMAFVCGLLLGQFSILHFGFLPLFYVLIAYLASLGPLDVLRGNWLLTGLFGMGLATLFELLIVLSLFFTGRQIELPAYLWHVVVVRVFLNTALMMLLFPLGRYLARNFSLHRNEKKS
jgi:rod shape-determining protein MreD